MSRANFASSQYKSSGQKKSLTSTDTRDFQSFATIALPTPQVEQPGSLRHLSEHSSEEDQQFEPINYEVADTVDFNVLCDGLHVMLINDSQGVFYPLLNLAMDHFKFKINKLFDDSICTSLLNAFASYYDSKYSEWEPLLERLKVQLMIKNGKKIVLEIKNDVNLNLTAELLSTVL